MKEKIIQCAQEGMTYKQIQLACGCPSKKYIKHVLKENFSELTDLLNDTKKLSAMRDKLFKDSLKEEYLNEEEYWNE